MRIKSQSIQRSPKPVKSSTSTTARQHSMEEKDYELLFTIEQSDFEKVKGHPHLSIIGHMTDEASGYNMVTGLGQQIELTAQGWNGTQTEE